MCWRDTLSNEEWWAQFRAERVIYEALHPQDSSTQVPEISEDDAAESIATESDKEA